MLWASRSHMPGRQVDMNLFCRMLRETVSWRLKNISPMQPGVVGLEITGPWAPYHHSVCRFTDHFLCTHIFGSSFILFNEFSIWFISSPNQLSLSPEKMIQNASDTNFLILCVSPSYHNLVGGLEHEWIIFPFLFGMMIQSNEVHHFSGGKMSTATSFHHFSASFHQRLQVDRWAPQDVLKWAGGVLLGPGVPKEWGYLGETKRHTRETGGLYFLNILELKRCCQL